MIYRTTISLIFLLLTGNVLVGQDPITREEYINMYANLAMEEMLRSGIPASITLAQGCLESDNGNSRLARDAKNHFGIKCHDWTGRKIYHDDDELQECFRKYRSVEESFIDHTEFLTGKQRYAGLFELKPDDYKGWARGLKSAGYATSRKYADHLIQIIEDNELQRYDQMVLAGHYQPGKRLRRRPGAQRPGWDGALPGSGSTGLREVVAMNGIECIISQPGDTPSSLRSELDLYPGEIQRYNDLGTGAYLDSGMIIYLQPKKRKAPRGFEFHTMTDDETLWDVSQLYGIRLSRLRRMNHLDSDVQPAAGTELWLRRKKPRPVESMESTAKPKEGPAEAAETPARRPSPFTEQEAPAEPDSQEQDTLNRGTDPAGENDPAAPVKLEQDTLNRGTDASGEDELVPDFTEKDVPGRGKDPADHDDPVPAERVEEGLKPTEEKPVPVERRSLFKRNRDKDDKGRRRLFPIDEPASDSSKMKFEFDGS